MISSRLAVFCMLPLLALGMKKRAIPSSFNLYGYGEKVAGFPLFYADGYAYIGQPAQSNSTDAAPVDFSLGSNNSWIGNPNTTLSTTPINWSNATFYIPASNSTDKRVGFLAGNASTSGAVETDFYFYGSTAIHISDTGALESNFYTLEISTDVFGLYWNDTSLGQVPVNLRTIAPSSPPSAK